MKHTYKFYVDAKNRKVIAASTYGGKVVKGYAKCSPEDEFDIEKGKAIAASRCDVKIAEKRQKRAFDRLKEAEDMLDKVRKMHSDAAIFALDATDRLDRSRKELSKTLSPTELY